MNIREAKQKLDKVRANQFKTRMTGRMATKVIEPATVRSNTVPVSTRGSRVDPDDFEDIE